MNDINKYTIDLNKTDSPMVGDFIVWGDLDLLKDPEDPKSRIIVCTCARCWRFVGLTVYDIQYDGEIRCSRCGATSKCNGIEYRSMREPLQCRMEAKVQQQRGSNDGEIAEVV